ncbi:MAG: carboxypeptidase-like regulatory domain-containing protein [Planctomycetia bacterium]|nr:carboxypeptidase-like regulatory domain-containing protein [Planctomycetia bacterium]
MIRRLTPLLFIAAVLPLAGCGARLSPVSGVVKLDGKPVAGAAVTFVSDDGKFTASAETDESGNFTLAHTTGPGTFPGNYKVTVTKYAKVEGHIPGAEGKIDKDYEKAMKKEMEKKGGTKIPTPKPGGVKGIQPPGGMMPGGAGQGGSSVKSELPEIYASIEKTPFAVKVPVEGPVQLDLKSKP